MSLLKQYITTKLDFDANQQSKNQVSPDSQYELLHQTKCMHDILSSCDKQQEQFLIFQQEMIKKDQTNHKYGVQRCNLGEKYFQQGRHTLQKNYNPEDCSLNTNKFHSQNSANQKRFCDILQMNKLDRLKEQINQRDKRIKILEQENVSLKLQVNQSNSQQKINSQLKQCIRNLQSKCKELHRKEIQNLKQIQTLKTEKNQLVEKKQLNQYLASRCVSLKGFETTSLSGVQNCFQDQSTEKDVHEQFQCQQGLLTIEQFNRVTSNSQKKSFVQFSQRKPQQNKKRNTDLKFPKPKIVQTIKKPTVKKPPLPKVDANTTKSQSGSKNIKQIKQKPFIVTSINTYHKNVQQMSIGTEKKIEKSRSSAEIDKIRQQQIKLLRKQVTQKCLQITQKDGSIQELQSKIKEIKKHFTSIITQKEEQKNKIKRKNLILKQYIEKLIKDNKKVLDLYKKSSMEHFQKFLEDKKQKYEEKIMNIINMLQLHYYKEVKRQNTNWQTQKQRSQRESIEKIITFSKQNQPKFQTLQLKDLKVSVQINEIIKSQSSKKDQNLKANEVDIQIQATFNQNKISRNIQITLFLDTSKNSMQIQTQNIQRLSHFQCQTQHLKLNYGNQFLRPQSQLSHTQSQTNFFIDAFTQTFLQQIIHQGVQFKVQQSEKQTQMSSLMVNCAQVTDLHLKINNECQCQQIIFTQTQCQSQQRISQLINTELIQMATSQTATIAKIQFGVQTLGIIRHSAIIQTQGKSCHDQSVGPDIFQIEVSTQIINPRKVSQKVNTEPFEEQTSTQIPKTAQKKSILINTDEFFASKQTQFQKKLKQTRNSFTQTEQTIKEASVQCEKNHQLLSASTLLVDPILQGEQTKLLEKNQLLQSQKIEFTITKQDSLNNSILTENKRGKLPQIPSKFFSKISQHQQKNKKQKTQNLYQKANINIKQKQSKQENRKFSQIFYKVLQKEEREFDMISQDNSYKRNCIEQQFPVQSMSKSMIRKTHFQTHEITSRKQNLSNDPNFTRNYDKSKQVVVELTQDQYKNLPVEVILHKIFKSVPEGFKKEQKVEVIDKKFKWKRQKYYYLETISEHQQLEKFILWRKGLLSLNSGKSLRLKFKGLTAQNKDMLILGNSQVIASGNELKVRLKKRNQMIGNIQNGTWKILNCEIFFPNINSQFF